jgi:hypothetical protein
VIFKDFEVAAVAMNGVDGMKLKNLRARSRRDVPILGQFSTAQFIKPFVDYLVLSGSSTKINGLSALQIQKSLKKSINNVHEDLILRRRKTINRRRHPSEWALFHNKFGIVDGNSYGFLINGVGVAVNGFPKTDSTDSPSNKIYMENVHVDFLKANIREIVSISANGSTGKAVNDPVGSLFQILAKGPYGQPLAMTEASINGVYLGNVVTNAQALVAKAANNSEFPAFLDVSRNSLNEDVISWVESGEPLSSYVVSAPGPHGTGFICNGDQMFHTNKGVIGFKLDGSKNVLLRKVSSSNVRNIGQAGSKLCGSYDISHPGANLLGYGGAITRGISISGSENVAIHSFTGRNILSSNGSAIGIDCFKGALEIKLPVPSVGPRPKMDQKSAASLCSKIDSAIDSVTCFNEMMNVYVGGEAFDKDAAAILCANNF